MNDLELTKKAEACASRQVGDMLTIQVDRNSRKSLAGSIEALIDMLDDLSPDPDLEDDGNAEPWLGWSGNGPRALSFDLDGRGSAYDDREADDSDLEDNGDERDASYTTTGAMGGHWCEDVEETNEDGGDIQDEPHDDGCDNEPWLGWGNTMGQPGVDAEGLEAVQDSPDYPSTGNFTGAGQGEARQMLRGRGRKEPSLSITIVGPPVTVPGWKGPLSRPDPDDMDLRAHYWAAKGF